MILTLPTDQSDIIVSELRRAGTNETGGQLFGEQLAPSRFRITEVTVQARRGTFARFVVDLMAAAKAAARFFERTNHEYRRFNYIGEWHSHPSFAVRPSGHDLDTMRRLVSDRSFVGSFAVLVIVRLDDPDLKAGAWFFDPAGREGDAHLEMSS